jgi:hypothetical protein
VRANDSLAKQWLSLDGRNSQISGISMRPKSWNRDISKPVAEMAITRLQTGFPRKPTLTPDLSPDLGVN